MQVRREATMVGISIKDTGVGISADKMKLFFQIDKTFSTKGTENESGTGLGLLLCAEFAAKNKGEIKVESEVGQGSRFTFTLPAAEQIVSIGTVNS
jgi:signal transduction histidine kinase